MAEALDLNPSLRAAQLNLSVLDEEGVTPAYPQLPDQSQVVPMTWVQALRAAGEDGPEPRLDELTASNAYLEAIYLGGDLAVRQLVAMLFARRLQAQPEARQGQGARRRSSETWPSGPSVPRRSDWVSSPVCARWV